MTAQQRKLPHKDDPQWEEWICVRKLSYRQIAAIAGVSHQAVGQACPLPPAHVPTHIESYSRHIPWSYDVADRDHELLRMLREVSRVYEKGKTTRIPVLVREFLEFMANATFRDGTPIGRGVVVYDLTQPAGDRFFVEPWRKGDGEFSRA